MTWRRAHRSSSSRGISTTTARSPGTPPTAPASSRSRARHALLWTAGRRQRPAVRTSPPFGRSDRCNASASDRSPVLFYLDRRPDPGRALAIARREAGRRRDVQTLDRLAWALFKNGRTRAAERLSKAILRTGTPDPLIARHAAQIGADRQGDETGGAPIRATLGEVPSDRSDC